MADDFHFVKGFARYKAPSFSGLRKIGSRGDAKTYKLKPTPLKKEDPKAAVETYSAPPPPSNGKIIALDCHPDIFTAAVLVGQTPHDARKIDSRVDIDLETLLKWASKEFGPQDIFLMEAGSNSFEVCKPGGTSERLACGKRTKDAIFKSFSLHDYTPAPLRESILLTSPTGSTEEPLHPAERAGRLDIAMRLLPLNIQVFGNELAIAWNDGTETFLALEFLRRHCPCAACGGEPDVLGHVEKPAVTYTPASFRIRSYQVIGGYALQPTWEDSHNSGLYAFQYLKRLGEAGNLPDEPQKN